MRFYFRRIHFVSGDVDYVRDPAHDLQRGTVSREDIVGNKNTSAKLLLVRVGKIAVTHCFARNADLARGLGWIDKLNFDTPHWLAPNTLRARCAVGLWAKPP